MYPGLILEKVYAINPFPGIKRSRKNLSQVQH